MKSYALAIFATVLVGYSLPIFSGEPSPCKTLKSCADWASDKTSAKYELGKLEKRGVKLEKDFDLSEGDPDFLFAFILAQNDLVRVKRENGSYQVIPIRELKDFHFPLVKEEEILNSFDYYSIEFTFSSKEKVKNAMRIFKKYLTKNGKLLEVTDATKILVTDLGIQLQGFKSMAKELSK